MSAVGGNRQVWFTAAELAALSLPGLSKVKRKVNELARERGWALKVDAAGAPLARPRAGQRGGGLEYHYSLLPTSAAAELMRRGLAVDATVEVLTDKPADHLWTWFDAQPTKVRAEAFDRLDALNAVLALEETGSSRTAAVAVTAASRGINPSTLWNWFNLVRGVPKSDRLPKLAPRWQGGGAEAEIDPIVWQVFKSDYLRPSAPTAASCYERAKAFAELRGIAIPVVKTFMRKLEREVDGRLIIAKRSGQDALRATIPSQQRTVVDLHALELVNIDGHRWDVFVRWPDGAIARPMMVAIQDVYSRKFLAWRIAETESAVVTRLAFADLFKRWGIPDGCLMDNGRAFASKWISGGAKTRFRFKIRPEEPTGLLTSLGIQHHWALPFRGSSKPIERGFRDFCDAIAKHPAFEGAYTGNRPDAKPENYGERAVDLDVFKAIVEQGIAAHNARSGRRTETARGGSFDDAFKASYERSAIRRAGPEQLRLALLAADQVTTDRKSGEITFQGNRYYHDDLHAIAGQRVTVRFDPDDLQSEIHVYTADGAYLLAAECRAPVGFLDMEAAKRRARMEADLKKKARALEAAENLLSAEQLAALLPNTPDDDAEPRPAAVRPVRTSGRAVAAQPAAARSQLIDRLDFEALAPARTERPRLRVVTE